MMVAVYNEKGGVGKTTTSVNLAAVLARRHSPGKGAGWKTVIVDADVQRDASIYRDSEPNVEWHHWSGGSLRSMLEELRRRSREGEQLHAVIDCPPAIGAESNAALRAADVVLVPVSSDFESMRGLSRLQEQVEGARNAGNPLLRMAVVMTMFNPRSEFCLDILQAVRSQVGPQLLTTTVRHSRLFKEAALHGETMQRYSRRSTGASDYRALVEELFLKFHMH